MPCSRPLSRPSAVLLGLLAIAPAGRAADYHVDVTAGVDDLALADGSAARPWRTLSFTLLQVPSTASHVIHLAAGEYSEASGESLPFLLPANIGLEGAPEGGTVIADTRAISAPTVAWQVRAPESLDAGNGLRHLRIERRADGLRAGRGVAVVVRSTSARPEFENLVITGAEAGIDLIADADEAAASVAPVITNCVLDDNGIGILATAYTRFGQDARADPILTNCVLAGNVDGAVFETAGAYGLSPGLRRNATSSPSLHHATIARNVGSGLVLDDTNLGLASGGAVRPEIVNCILSAAEGDYAVSELSSTSSPSELDSNLMEASPLGLYLDDGRDPLSTIAEVNALNGASGNFAGRPLFVRELAPGWRLRADSPGVDRATGSALAADLEGDPRPSDSDGDGTARSEVGCDEAPNCAVTAELEPSLPEDRCGPSGSLDFDASASGISPGFPECSEPLEFRWFVDGLPIDGATTPLLSVDPERDAIYAVQVRCPDHPQCLDTATAPVRVHELPTADAGAVWRTCLPSDADGLALELAGSATAPPGAAIRIWSWTTDSPYVAILGGATPTPVLELSGYADFADLSFDVELTVTDSNGCTASDRARVDLLRGPRVRIDGPFVSCSQEGGSSAIRVGATVETAPGAFVAGYEWAVDAGDFDDPTAAEPLLFRNNLPFSVQSVLGLSVSDDRGCTASAEPARVSFHPSPTANAGGPYQLPEDPGGTTSFALDGSASAARTGALAFRWSTDLGDFVPASADADRLRLDIANTGADQSATLCLDVTDENGCSRADCTSVSVKASALQPPNDVGGTLRIAERGGEALLSWENAILDPAHDLADRYELWQSSGRLPDLGGWTPRAVDVPPRGGVTLWADAALLDPEGPDRLFLKVVARNDAGSSCAPPPPPRLPLDPDCPP